MHWSQQHIIWKFHIISNNIINISHLWFTLSAGPWKSGNDGRVFFVLIWGGAICFINYKTKYAHYPMFMLEPILHLGAQQVDALNFFSKFLFVWLVIFWIIWVQTLKILSLTQPVFKYIILRYKTTNTVFIAMLFGCTFRLYWAHCVRYRRSVKVPNLFTEEDKVGEENSDVFIVYSRASAK